MEAAFVRRRNITFDIYLLFSRKQKRRKNVDQFFSRLKEITESFSFIEEQETIIINIFLTNMSDTEIQHHLIHETFGPNNPHQTAINMEIEVQNQTRQNFTTQLTMNSSQANGGYCPAKRQQQFNMNFTRQI